jgi:hypothetical protein
LSSENRGAATAGINKPKAKKNAELQRQLVLNQIKNEEKDLKLNETEGSVCVKTEEKLRPYCHTPYSYRYTNMCL